MKRFFIMLGVMTAFLAGGSISRAEEPMGLYLEGLGGVAIPTDDNLETSPYAGGRLGYRFTPLLSIEAESGYASFDIKNTPVDLNIVPLMGNVKLYLFSDPKMDIYVFGGAGVIFTDVEDDSDDIEVDEIDFSFDEDADDAFAAQGGAGIIYHFTPHISAFAEGRFLFSDFDTSGGEDIELHSALIDGGLRITF